MRKKGTIDENVMGLPKRFLLGLQVRGKAVNCQSYGGQSRKVLLLGTLVYKGGNVICIDFIKLRVEIG